MKLCVTPLTGSIGAAVEGIRLDEPIEDRDLDELRSAFLRYSTLVFRDQFVKPLAQVEFARLWGEPVVTEMLHAMENHPEIVQLANIKKETTATEAWHYDGSSSAAPPKVSMLSAVTTPVGGDTMWSNQYLAYERLSPALRDVLDGLKVRFRGIRLGRMMNVAEEDTPTAVHPLVRTHPETGRKALFVGHRENACVDGWTQEESEALLDMLYRNSVTPDNVYRHSWREGDFVMWDNRCTMHYAVHDYGDQKRVLNRITLRGEVPA
ncbi:TauD/TfdA family dioxygenase [Rhodococcus olei]|uniref:TauD/TfdA family dioxygenase n=1 Tax=Rhodococcus olei TaxID=2161675 RepID=A0ABP8PKX2_9NOCA